MSNRERQARYRARQRSKKAAALAVVPPAKPMPADPIGALALWSADVLRVPAGHPEAGKPMVLPDYAIAYLRDAVAAQESLLCMGRKNSKSGICAVAALGYLCGPLAQPGWRGAVASLSGGKADELRAQVEAIATASGLADQLTFRRSPYPGKVVSATGELEILAADRTAGHASGFDVVIVDELGLFPERARELMAGLRSSISAKAGRVLCISVRGDSPLLQEMIDRRGPACPVHLYAAPDGCELDDRAAWAAANPGIAAGIKSLAYMEAEAARVAVTPADQGLFRAFDLNERLDPARAMIVMPDQWRRCEVAELPPRAGDCVLGFDAGGSAAMTAAAAYWPDTGRMEAWAAFPGRPSLKERGMADGVGALYVQMAQRGELWQVGGGLITDVAGFLGMVRDELGDTRICAMGADRYRRAEIQTMMDAAPGRWPSMTWRGTGAHKNADGSHDVRAFQTAVLSGRVAVEESLLWRHGVASTTLRTDEAGNPALYRASERLRIDVVQAGVIATGLAALKPKRRPRRWALAG